MPHHRALLAILSIVTVLAGGGIALAQKADKQPGTMMPRQIELSEKSARNAIDAYLVIKDKFGDGKIKSVTGPGAALVARSAMAAFRGITDSHGFATPEEWQRTLTTFLMTFALAKEGRLARMDEQIRQMEGNPSVPKAMVELMKNSRPSENNIKVMQAVSSDPAYAAKILNARGR